MPVRRGRSRLFRAAASAAARGDWVGALGAMAAVEPRLALHWLRLRRARGPVAARSGAEGRRLAAAIAVEAAEETLIRARQYAAAIETFAPDAWQEHRSAHPVPPPPAALDALVSIVIDARNRFAVELRATLLSLVDQAHASWRAYVIADEGASAEPVASLAAIDPRIAFARMEDDEARRPTILLDAGMVLDRHAVGWLGHGLARTGASAVYADQDRLFDDPRFGRSWAKPSLFGVFDPDLARTGDLPALIAFADGGGLAGELDTLGMVATRHSRLLGASRQNGVAHVPYPLASRLMPTIATRRAPPVPSPPTEPPRPPALAAVAAIATAVDTIRPLRVVMPTRDEPALLRDAVTSLLDRADDPAAITLIVVDNRSADPATARMLSGLRRDRGITVVTHDEPFNWSRINNLAVREGEEPGLLFINNHTRMLSRGWDRMLAAGLARPDVGAVGARLLYPDGTIQHVGVALGVGTSPMHEGVGAAPDDPGPLGRWHATRSVAAVTGAFLAIRRDLFSEIGGFDELRLAVGYNDVDLCLRVRETGRRVLFLPDIELVHLESKTRGMNVALPRVAWDEGELATLRVRWGDALDRDPGLNPRWARCERPFEGYRMPSEAEVIEWIDRSAKDAWRVTRAGS